MRYSARFLMACLVAGILFFSSISDAYACRCVPASFKYRWSKSNAVLVGTVSEIKPLYKYAWSQYDDKPVQVTLKVKEYWKGGDGDSVDVESLADREDGEEPKMISKTVPGEDGEGEEFLLHTSLQNLTCMGYPFKEGSEYLIFAYERKLDEAEPWSLYNYPSETFGVGGLCGGTKAITDRSVKSEMKRIHTQVEADGTLQIFSSSEDEDEEDKEDKKKKKKKK